MFSKKKGDKKGKSLSSHGSHRSHHGRHRSHQHDRPEDPIEEHLDEPDDGNEDEDEDDLEESFASGPQNPSLPLQTSSSSNPATSSSAQTSNPSSSREPDYYYDIGIPPTVGSLRVRVFRVVSHTTGLIYGEAPQNASHWSIYLIHNNGSIRLSMDTDKRLQIPYPRGRLSTYTYDYTSASNSAVRFWDFPAIKNVTVKDVYLTIGNHRCDSYNTGDNARGCRYWV